MTDLRFEWDEAKNRSNQRKHGISFEQGSQVFRDPLHRTRQDRIESGKERCQTIGLARGYLVLVLAHTISEDEEDGQYIEIIRIISARRADRTERRQYENQNG